MPRVLVEITYENQDAFQVKTKVDDGEPIVIVRAEENGCIGCIWNDLQKTCMAYFRTLLEDAGKVMKEV